MHTRAQIQKLSKARLVALVMFLLAITKKRAPKIYRTAEARAHIRTRSKTRKKRRRKGKRNNRAAKAMRYMRSHKVSLKEAWRHV